MTVRRCDGYLISVDASYLYGRLTASLIFRRKLRRGRAEIFRLAGVKARQLRRLSIKAAIFMVAKLEYVSETA